MLLGIDIYLLLDLLLIVSLKALVNYQNLYDVSPLSNGITDPALVKFEPT
jgi:hypothetical protein